MIKFSYYKSNNSVMFCGETNNLKLNPRLNGTNEREKQVYDDQT